MSWFCKSGEDILCIRLDLVAFVLRYYYCIMLLLSVTLTDKWSFEIKKLVATYTVRVSAASSGLLLEKLFPTRKRHREASFQLRNGPKWKTRRGSACLLLKRKFDKHFSQSTRANIDGSFGNPGYHVRSANSDVCLLRVTAFDLLKSLALFTCVTRSALREWGIDLWFV